MKAKLKIKNQSKKSKINTKIKIVNLRLMAENWNGLRNLFSEFSFSRLSNEYSTYLKMELNGFNVYFTYIFMVSEVAFLCLID